MGQIVKHRVKKNLIRAKESLRFFYISRLFAVYTTLREIRPLTDQIMPVNKYLIIFALFILSLGFTKYFKINKIKLTTNELHK